MNNEQWVEKVISATGKALITHYSSHYSLLITHYSSHHSSHHSSHYSSFFPHRHPNNSAWIRGQINIEIFRNSTGGLDGFSLFVFGFALQGPFNALVIFQWNTGQVDCCIHWNGQKVDQFYNQGMGLCILNDAKTDTLVNCLLTFRKRNGSWQVYISRMIAKKLLHFIVYRWLYLCIVEIDQII